MERYFQFSFTGSGPLFRAGALSVEVRDSRLIILMKGDTVISVPAEQGEYGIEWTDSELRLYRNDQILEIASLQKTYEYGIPEILGDIKQLVIGRGRFPYS